MFGNRKPSAYLIILSSILVAMALMMLILVHQAERSIRNDARVINEAGIVRGSIQRITKLVLHAPENLPSEVISTVDDLLAQLTGPDRSAFGEDEAAELALLTMERHWLELKRQLFNYSSDPADALRQQLIVHSEICWATSLNMVYMAQTHSEFKMRRIERLMYFMLFLISLGAASVVAMLVLYVRRRLEYESARDHLTGLYNRRSYDRIVEAEIARSNRYSTPLSLLIIDIDLFKRINDEMGHKIGDRVLIEFSRLMASSIRETDRLFRVGGEEFVILTPGADAEVAFRMAEKLRVKVKSRDFSIGRPVTISIGCAEFVNGDSSDKLYQRADQALYQAKSAGRDICCKA